MMKRPPLFALFATAMVLVLFVAAFLWNTVQQQSSVRIDVSRDAVVTQMRALSRYETSSFTIEKIIEADTGQSNAFSQFLFGDRILLIAHGEVIAGFDLSGLESQDVQIINQNISVTLPSPQILVTRLDSEKTRVYDRSQGLLTQGDQNLESNARAAAEQSIRQAACESGILLQATDNARSQLTTILQTIGFETVMITIPAGDCG